MRSTQQATLTRIRSEFARMQRPTVIPRLQLSRAWVLQAFRTVSAVDATCVQQELRQRLLHTTRRATVGVSLAQVTRWYDLLGALPEATVPGSMRDLVDELGAMVYADEARAAAVAV